MDCVYHHKIGGKVILGIFSYLHFFSGRERNDVVVCLACGSGTFSGRLSLRLAVWLAVVGLSVGD